MGRTVKSDFLFAQPSGLSGCARTIDLFGTFDEYNNSDTTLEADTKAIASDWIIVGQDLTDAVQEVTSVQK